MKKYFGLIWAALAIIIAVLGMIFLPDNLVTQIGVDGQASSHMNKYLALGLPAGLTVLFSALGVLSEDEKGGKYKYAAPIVLVVLVISVLMNLPGFK